MQTSSTLFSFHMSALAEDVALSAIPSKLIGGRLDVATPRRPEMRDAASRMTIWARDRSVRVGVDPSVFAVLSSQPFFDSVTFILHVTCSLPE